LADVLNGTSYPFLDLKETACSRILSGAQCEGLGKNESGGKSKNPGHHPCSFMLLPEVGKKGRKGNGYTAVGYETFPNLGEKK
jgi:hypothetical protein